MQRKYSLKMNQFPKKDHGEGGRNDAKIGRKGGRRPRGREKEKCGLRCEAQSRQRLSSNASPRVCARVRVCALGPLHIVAHTNGRGAREPCAFTNFWRHVHSHSRPRRLHTQAAGPSVHARIRLLIGACRDRLGATKFGAPHRKTPGALPASGSI